MDAIKKIKYIVIAIAVLFSLQAWAGSKEEQLLQRLDSVVSMREPISKQREAEIAVISNQLTRSDDRRRFELCLELSVKYDKFVLDSAMVWARRAMSIALSLNDVQCRARANVQMAWVYNNYGLYSDAMDALATVHAADLNPEDRPHYYNLIVNANKNMSTYSLDNVQREHFKAIYASYTDSVNMIQPSNVGMRARALEAEGRIDEAIVLLKTNVKDGETTSLAGVRFFILSQLYQQQGNVEMQRRYLIYSAIADITNANRDYISLRILAEMLMEEGDLKRAYKYIHVCAEDAYLSGSRTRQFECSSLIATIDKQLVDRDTRRRTMLVVLLAVVSVITLLAAVQAFLLRRRNRALERTSLERDDALKRLETINIQLVEDNAEQLRLNQLLEESNQVKETYVLRFMALCRDYLHKMENYRNYLNKVAAKRNFDDLLNAVSSTRYIHREMSEFYANFDEAYLKLFPTFVADVKALMRTEDAIPTPAPGKLNTELRIVALQRLGVSDVEQVSEFLQCSISTVYNYRSKLRNNARDKDLYEAFLKSKHFKNA